MTVPTRLDRQFRDAAARAGLLDTAYDVIESELGPLLAAVTDHGLARISFDPEPERELELLARLAGPRVLRSPRALDETRRELDAYFAGRRTAFDLELDLRGLPAFTLRVLGELAKVPYGQTATYGELAERAGNPRASRAVGTVMNRNRIPIVLPCHRIVGTSGELVGYGGGLPRKERLLRLEGAIL
ncbi:MAG: methylated-DNA--[protein]-cysteine S-methyltransferase [Gaiella sp.]|nr:methylated-DNA--[protein]-cysteine S-methyltransferase [Gaiella sp.]